MHLTDGGRLAGAQPAQVLHLPGVLPSTSLHRSRTSSCLGFPHFPQFLPIQSADGAARGGRRSRVSRMSQARISQPGLGASCRRCGPGLGTGRSRACATARLAPAAANPPWGKMPQNGPGRGQDLSSCHPRHPSAAGAHATPKSTPSPFGHGMSVAPSAGSGRCGSRGGSWCHAAPPPSPTVPPWMQAPGQAGDGGARPGCCGDVPAPLLTSDGGKSCPQSK